MIFINNKYTRWYYGIINNAQNRNIVGYAEKHHIIPKSLGGSNKKDNLVSFTAREHYICHRLLVKMVIGDHKRKMAHALWLMSNLKNQNQTQRYTPNSIVYSHARSEFSKIMSDTFKGVKKRYSSFGGKKHSQESLIQMKNSKLGDKNPNYGVKQKPEWNKAKSDAQKGILKPILICENCDKKIGGHSNYKRWHGDNCKLNKTINI